jgi:hypothetical protein
MDLRRVLDARKKVWHHSLPRIEGRPPSLLRFRFLNLGFSRIRIGSHSRVPVV